jgi:hypothetical protein
VVRRATRIINEITRREENAAYSKLTEFARRGEIDRLVELLVRRPKWEDEDACWQVVTELSGKLFDLEKKTYRRTSFPSPGGLPVGDFRRYVQLSRPQRVAGSRVALKPGRFVVRAEHITSGKSIASASLLASSRSTRVHGEFTLGLVLAGGPVEVESMVCSIVVCAGGCKARRDVRGCLIIARGDVEFSGDVAGCHIVTSGSVIFAPGKMRHENKVQEHEPNPLGFVKWFDPARVGVTVEAAAGGVRVKAAGKSFAAAGLRAGDLVTAIDGEVVKSPDEFRLLLRAKLADGGKMAFTVRRAGQDLKIPVRCKD